MSLDTTQVYVRSMTPSSVVCVMYWTSPPLVLFRPRIMKVRAIIHCMGGCGQMLDVDVPHIYYLHVYGPDGLSTEIGFLILDEISSIYLPTLCREKAWS